MISRLALVGGDSRLNGRAENRAPASRHKITAQFNGYEQQYAGVAETSARISGSETDGERIGNEPASVLCPKGDPYVRFVRLVIVSMFPTCRLA